MKLRRQKLYEGPNFIAPVSVVQMAISINPDEAAALQTPEIGDLCRTMARQLEQLFPALPSRLEPEKPALPLFPEDRVYSPLEMVGYVALFLQREFGFEVRFVQSPASATGETFDVCYENSGGALGLSAGEIAVALVDTAWSENAAATRSGNQDRVTQFHARAMNSLKSRDIDVTTRRLVWEGERRGIPWSQNYSSWQSSRFFVKGHVQLGHGHKQKRFFGTMTSDTSLIATTFAGSKQLTHDFFAFHGIPVPHQVPVRSADAAADAARRVGYPVAVKPERADAGRGVQINLKDEESVRAAFEAAQRYGIVLVGQYIPGNDYRVTLINGRMVAAGPDIAARVTGDGRSTVEDLIEIINSDPRRGRLDCNDLLTIVVDDEIRRTLEEQNASLTTVPEKGQVIELRRWWRTVADQTSEDVTDIVHPINRDMLERAARMVGLDIAGIDFITPDISRPWTEVGGAVLEINAMPDLLTHVRAGAPDVVSMVIDRLFPDGDDGRIPIAALAGTDGAVRKVGEILKDAGHVVGLATHQGVEIGDSVATNGDYSGPTGIRIVLDDPLAEAAVFQLSADKIADEGLGLDRFAVGAAMAPLSSQARDATVPTDTTGLIVEAATDLAVLNADDPACASLASRCRAKRICWVTKDPETPLAADHIASGGPLVAVAEPDGIPAICLWDGEDPAAPKPVVQLGASGRDMADGEILENMFAAAVAFGLGVPLPVISEALADMTSAGNPTGASMT